MLGCHLSVKSSLKWLTVLPQWPLDFIGACGVLCKSWGVWREKPVSWHSSVAAQAMARGNVIIKLCLRTSTLLGALWQPPFWLGKTVLTCSTVLDNMQVKACWYSGNTTTHLGAHLCTLFLGCALDPDHYCQIRSAWEGWNLWQMLPDATSMSLHMLLHRDFSNVLSSLMSGSRFNYQYGIFNGPHKYDFTAIKCCYWFL